jgi:hypothetical protein
MEKNVKDFRREHPESRVGEPGQGQVLRRRLMLTVCYALARNNFRPPIYLLQIRL